FAAFHSTLHALVCKFMINSANHKIINEIFLKIRSEMHSQQKSAVKKLSYQKFLLPLRSHWSGSSAG
ncbi:MAG: hypothetical protein K2G53_05400, partial [Muribaculaceae bacterium]|nr:hypothetical protein [Muribaculaceae bacterium]